MPIPLTSRISLYIVASSAVAPVHRLCGAGGSPDPRRSALSVYSYTGQGWHDY